MGVDQCIDARRVLSKCENKIGSLGLQKRAISTTVGFFGVLFPSLMLLLVMAVVLVVVIIQE